MWANTNHVNSNHEDDDDDDFDHMNMNNNRQQQQQQQIRLYQPISSYTNNKKHTIDSSFIGGIASSTSQSQEQYSCTKCNELLYLIVQLHSPLSLPNEISSSSSSMNKKIDRTFQVYCCNNSSCINSLFEQNDNDITNNMLQYGGNGIIKCVSINNNINSKEEQTKSIVDITTITTKTKNSSLGWDINKDDINEWSNNDNDIVQMNDLTAQLAQLESKTNNNNNNNSKKDKIVKSGKITDNGHNDKYVPTNNAFQCYELNMILEPPIYSFPKNDNNIDDDDDDVGMSVGMKDDKIQAMLNKYLKEEDDIDIINAISNSTNGGGGNGKSNKKGEKDERLSINDKSLFTYTDRLKHYPKQVIRYIYNGIPIWSIPIVSLSDHEKRQQQQDGKKKNSKFGNNITKSLLYGIDYPIPPCKLCGTARVFEFQILPSILHILRVDDYNNITNTGGMDWGNIAIYTCPNGCCQIDEELCIIQNTIDNIQPHHIINYNDDNNNNTNNNNDNIKQQPNVYNNDNNRMNTYYDEDDDNSTVMDGEFVDLNMGYDDDDDDW